MYLAYIYIYIFPLSFHWMQAADAAEADNKKQDKLKSLLKIATLCSAGEGGVECDFAKAADIFEAMGHEGMESKLGEICYV